MCMFKPVSSEEVRERGTMATTSRTRRKRGSERERDDGNHKQNKKGSNKKKGREGGREGGQGRGEGGGEICKQRNQQK